MAKFLTLEGLTYFYGLLKSKFVAQEAGKTLTTNDFTTAEKTKLAGIATGANSYSLPIASATVLGGVKAGSNVTINSTTGVLDVTKANVVSALGFTPPTADSNTTYTISKAGNTVTLTGSDGSKTTFTDSDTTYSTATASVNGLMSSADKSKLDGIYAGAQANVLEKVSVNGTALAISSKGVNIDLSTYAKKSDISKAVIYQATVSTYADLPTTGVEVGWMYNVQTADATHDVAAGDNLVWNGTAWDNQRGSIDLSGYATKTELQNVSSNISVISNSDIDAIMV